MDILRTPDSAFDSLEDYDFEPRYFEVNTAVGTPIRVHYVDEGEGPLVLLMHGQPSWVYLYRKVIRILVGAGYRVVAPDLVGFGRSDKPAAQEDYTYARHVSWITEWFMGVGLENVTLFCQDWGGLVGLRLVAAMPERFRAVVAANTGLPTGDQQMPKAFDAWKKWCATTPVLDVGLVLQGATVSDLTDEVVAGYNAPFPDDSFQSGARAFPSLVPADPADPEADAQRFAWTQLMAFDKPFLTAFSDSDPITGGGDRVFQKLVPGAEDMPHRTIESGGHFLQEDQPHAVAEAILAAFGVASD
jgi:haloalkane dehalogenase